MNYPTKRLFFEKKHTVGNLVSTSTLLHVIFKQYDQTNLKILIKISVGIHFIKASCCR